MDKLRYSELIISNYASINGYRLFIIADHEDLKVTELQQTYATQYGYRYAKRTTEVSSFKQVRNIFNQLVNQGYEVIKDY